MAKTEGIPASNDDTLLALIASLQGLTLALQGKKCVILTFLQTLMLLDSKLGSYCYCSAGNSNTPAHCTTRFCQ